MLQAFWDYLRTQTRNAILKGAGEAFEMLNHHAEESGDGGEDQPELLIEWAE